MLVAAMEAYPQHYDTDPDYDIDPDTLLAKLNGVLYDPEELSEEDKVQPGEPEYELIQRLDARIRQLTEEFETRVTKLRGEFGLDCMVAKGEIDASLRKALAHTKPLTLVT